MHDKNVHTDGPHVLHFIRENASTAKRGTQRHASLSLPHFDATVAIGSENPVVGITANRIQQSIANANEAEWISPALPCRHPEYELGFVFDRSQRFGGILHLQFPNLGAKRRYNTVTV